MRTENDLRTAYDYLADTAPTADVLHLTGVARAPERRTAFGRIPIGLATAAVVVAIAGGSLALTHTGKNGGHPATHPIPLAAAQPANYPTKYLFGTASLPGYAASDLSLEPTGQRYDFTPAHAPTGAPAATAVNVQIFTPTAGQLATISRYAPVSVGAAHGFYGPALRQTTPTPLPTVFWQVHPGQWAAFVGFRAADRTASLAKADLVHLAATLVPKTDDHVALVKVGYLPNGMQFGSAAQYVDQGLMLSPDGTSGTGYRDLSFVVDSVGIGTHSSLDIASVIHPVLDLNSATKADLPTLDNGPWTKITVQGHLAWIAPHDVLIQWGDVQIGVASTRIEGDTTTPLVSQAELLKVANSLTVPASVDIGQGYPLATAIPPNAFR